MHTMQLRKFLKALFYRVPPFSQEKKSSKGAGFTLLEILLVFGIAAILAAATAPGFFRYRAARQLPAQVTSVVAVLRATQARAVSQEGGNQWGVHFEYPASDPQFYQVFSGASWAAGTKEVRTNLGTYVTFVAPASGASTDVIFTKRTGTTTAATITLALKSAPSTTQEDITVAEQGTIESE